MHHGRRKFHTDIDVIFSMITIGILRCGEGTAVGIADIAGIIFVMALTSSCVFGHWKDIDIDVVGIDIGIVGIVGMLVVVVRMKWNGQCGQWRIRGESHPSRKNGSTSQIQI